MDQGDAIVTKIKDFLNFNSIKYSFIEHEPTPTSEDAARVRGTKPQEGAKAIILKLSKSKTNAMVVLPGNLKIDSKKVRNILNEDISFEDANIILEKFGIIVGGVPPFANILDSQMKFFVDKKLFDNQKISFNCGKRTASITMNSQDYLKILQDKITVGDYSKEQN